MEENEECEHCVRSPIQTEVPKNSLYLLWDKLFNANKYTNILLPLHEDFPNNFKDLCQMGTRNLSNIVESHLLRGLMIKRVLLEAHAQKNKYVDRLQVNLTTTKEALTQEQESLKNLTKERKMPINSSKHKTN